MVNEEGESACLGVTHWKVNPDIQESVKMSFGDGSYDILPTLSSCFPLRHVGESIILEIQLCYSSGLRVSMFISGR